LYQAPPQHLGLAPPSALVRQTARAAGGHRYGSLRTLRPCRGPTRLKMQPIAAAVMT
jgi:hypothetical protein